MTTKTKRKELGFTLIELLLVMVILAVLAAVVVPRLTGYTLRARIVAAQTDVRTIIQAIDTFEVTASRYPTSDEGLQALMERPSDVTVWTGPYLKEGSLKDPWGHPYQYRVPGEYNNDFDVYSLGPDGQEGTDDDIGNWTS